MQPYDACRLIAVNLFSFVNNPFTLEAKFNFEKFYEVNYEAMRLSDDLIDLEIEHIDRIIEKIKNDKEPYSIKERELDLWTNVRKTAMSSRRTGLGITALGDTLAALGYKYDSVEALEVVENIMHSKMESELDCTIDLAILRGTFQGWDNTLEYPLSNNGNVGYNGNDFYSFIRNNFPEQYNRMYLYGRRNISFSTVAPTGSVSILTRTSSGIEPLFQPFYMRRKKINPGEAGVRVDFVDELGDSWQEFPVVHPKLKDWYNIICKGDTGAEFDAIQWTKEGLENVFNVSPWYKSTANDIDWVKRVEMQSIIQKYISHSISSTINLPNNVTEEEVSKIYMESWKKGLKGITVYRDGARSGVLVTEKEKESKFKYHSAPKRPKRLKADLYTTKSRGTTYAVIVGLLENKPYEVFVFNSLDMNYPECSGEIIKIKQGHYKFKSDELIIENINESGNTDLEKAAALYTSMLLRHGADIHYVIKTAKKINNSISHFISAMCRVLNKYDTTKEELVCIECGGKVIKENGCEKCLDCGHSKCD